MVSIPTQFFIMLENSKMQVILSIAHRTWCFWVLHHFWKYSSQNTSLHAFLLFWACFRPTDWKIFLWTKLFKFNLCPFLICSTTYFKKSKARFTEKSLFNFFSFYLYCVPLKVWYHLSIRMVGSTELKITNCLCNLWLCHLLVFTIRHNFSLIFLVYFRLESSYWPLLLWSNKMPRIVHFLL